MKNTRVLCLTTLLLALWGQSGGADPLHKYGHEGAWIHADSGWVFPARIGEFARLDAPYTIDGNNDVGVEYERLVDGVRTLATVEVFSRQSAAEHATLATARAAMETSAGSLEERQAFVIEGKPELGGSRLKFSGMGDAAASLYFLESNDWVVNVRSSAAIEASAGTEILDAFVRALPWDTLGSDSTLH